MLQPRDTRDLAEAIADAALDGTRLAIRGGGSKDGIGSPSDALPLAMHAFAGVIDYDPAELVLTAGAATPLAEIEALVAGQGQMLAFAPFDHGPLFGRAAGSATLGGVIAAGVAGSQRLSQGGSRDHLLGFQAVSGRGEAFTAGAKVVKNVTGYDLPKLAAGSWGRLFAMTEVTLKVLPAPRAARTLAIAGLGFVEAQVAMAAAIGSTAEVAAAAYLPGGATSSTLFRLQGFAPSVAARSDTLSRVVAPFGTLDAVDDGCWDGLTSLAALPAGPSLWRINLPPSRAPVLIAAFPGIDWLADWAGGLLWLAYDGPADTLRAAAEAAGGHAMLVRASAAHEGVPMLHPQPSGVAALEARVRRAFDPAGVFETGRFG